MIKKFTYLLMLSCMAIGTFNPLNGFANCSDPIIINHGPSNCPGGQVLTLDYCWEEIQTCVKECFYKCEPLPPVCGNGILENGEACDDGNNIDDDSCDNNCQINPECGNGIVEPGEACDDGNNIDDDSCTNSCQLNPSCGNGILDPGEQCDDGNDINYDFCTNLCKDNFLNNPPPPPAAAFCSDVATPTAIWRLDGTMEDFSSNSNTGISTSDSYQPGRFGQAHQSFGSAWEGVNINDHSSIEAGSENFSISLWIKTQDQSFILIKKGADAITGYKFFYEFGKLIIRFENFENLNQMEYSTPLPNLNDGGWHHIVFTMDRTKEDGGRIYYDGYPSPMTPSSWLDLYAFDPTLFPQALSNQEYLHIGGNTFESMTGLKDQVVFFKKALSYAEARALFLDDCFTQDQNMGNGGGCLLNHHQALARNSPFFMSLFCLLALAMLMIGRISSTRKQV